MGAFNSTGTTIRAFAKENTEKKNASRRVVSRRVATCPSRRIVYISILVETFAVYRNEDAERREAER